MGLQNVFLIVILPSIVLAYSAIRDKKLHYMGDTVYHVYGNVEEKKEQLQSISEKYDVWRAPRFEGESLDVLVPHGKKGQFLSYLQANNLRHDVMIENVGAEIFRQDQKRLLKKMAESDKAMNFDYFRYHTLDEIENWMLDIANEYSRMTEIIQVSESYEGRIINAFKISTGGSGKPALWLDGGIHSREWISPATIIYFVKSLLEGYSEDAEIRDLLDRADWYILPVFNVDGFVYTHVGDRLWRKTRSPNPGSSCVGCDPNRNWDYVWGGVGTSPNPCSNIFPGRSAFSEVEVRRVAEYISSIPNVKMVVAYHNYGQMYMLPYGYSSAQNPDFGDQMAICNEVIGAIFDTHGEIYRCDSLINLVGPNSGSSVDYTYGVLNIKYSFGVELRDRGSYGFLLPENQIQPTVEENFNGLKVLARKVLDEA